MAKLKLKKLPKKPKVSASLRAKLDYLKKVNEVFAENKRITSENKKSAELSKKIAGIGSHSMRSYSAPTKKKKASPTKKKKTTKKKK